MRVAHRWVTREAGNGGRQPCCTPALWGPWYGRTKAAKQCHCSGVVLGAFFCLQPRQPRLAQAEAQHEDGGEGVVRKEGGRGGDGSGGGGCSRKEHRAALTHLRFQQCSMEMAAGRLGFSFSERGRVNKLGE